MITNSLTPNSKIIMNDLNTTEVKKTQANINSALMRTVRKNEAKKKGDWEITNELNVNCCCLCFCGKQTRVTILVKVLLKIQLFASRYLINQRYFSFSKT